ncbi:MAG: HEAT repeat domain-containing protein [Deltaproteobacteria bacterium]|nr:HEAT repeat domain-containing protein [Deltaproteobacteria bacterium]
MVDELEGRKQIDLGEEVPSVEGQELDETFLQARDLMSTFVKTIKAFRLYPAENPSLAEFQGQLLRKFQSFLKKYHSFVFQIGEYEFSFREKILYENRDLKTSLAFRLYKDGLRELRFMEGLEVWEVQGLIDILKRIEHINQLEDDVVTMMWETDFVHISFLATDPFLEEAPITIPENVAEFRRRLIFEPLAHKVDQDFRVREEEEEDEEAMGVDEILDKILFGRVGPPPSAATYQGVYSLTPEELERLKKEVETESDPTSVFNVIDILFEILALEKELEPYQDAVNVLTKLLDALLTLGEFQKASDLLTRMNIILNTYQLKDWQVKLIQQLIESAGDPQRIERVGRILEKGMRVEEVNSYLVLLKPNSISPLIKVLGELNNSKARRMLCEAICEIGKNNIEMITPFINDHRWYLVRNITYILARIGKEQALPYIQKALNHAEIRVKREAIQALGIIGGSKAFALLVKGLADGDVRIRSMSALNLAKVGKKASLPYLLEVVQSKEFPNKEKAEMKAFFDAIGMVGSNEANKVLEKLLEKRSWFGDGKWAEIRQGAASALALIGTPEAKSILQSGIDSKDAKIRQACVQAMERLTF